MRDAESTDVQRGTGPGTNHSTKAPEVPPDARGPGLAAPPSPCEWGRALGGHLRTLRRLAGLSQERLARLIATSQPALSRLEKGRVAKQVFLVLRVGQVINRTLSRVDQAALTEETRALLKGLETLSAGQPHGSSVARDPGLEELIHIYCDASPTQRRGILAVVRGWRAAHAAARCDSA
jgi:transcriptional regulator with XRE-family HTH domain